MSELIEKEIKRWTIRRTAARGHASGGFGLSLF